MPGKLGGSASTTSVGYDANVKVDLFAFKTYSVLPWPLAVTASSSFEEVDAMSAVTRAMRITMTRQDFKELPMHEADLVLNVRGSALPENDVAAWGFSYSDTKLWTASYDPTQALPVVPGNCVLVVEVFQRSDAKLVWAGWRQSHPKLGPFWYSSAIKSILENFPPVAGW
jgi:hypothetical protein